VTLQGVGWNATRTGVLDALRLFGAPLTAVSQGDGEGYEPVSQMRIVSGSMRGGPIDGELLARAGQAGPLVALIGACSARGATLFDPAFCSELQPDPWAHIAAVLGGFGVAAIRQNGSLRVEPTRAIEPATVDALGSPALGLLALGLALVAKGESLLQSMPVLDEQWPGLLGVLAQLGARIEVQT
jgi:5-enolpyruvylshikimate-3-phosphate synthase